MAHRLWRSLPRLSKIGFGTARLGYAEEPRFTLEKALRSRKINVIDTSPDHRMGAAETIVGDTLKSLAVHNVLSRRDVVLMTNFGNHLVGVPPEDSQTVSSARFPDGITVSPGMEHSIHPDAIKSSLESSLNRLGTQYVDCYFMFNPEFYLIHSLLQWSEAKSIDLNSCNTNAAVLAAVEEAKKPILETLKHRISLAFEALERHVADRRILSYGISSTMFAKPLLHPFHIPYDEIYDLATAAAKKIRGTSESSLAAIQMPANILERRGVEHNKGSAAMWAKQRGLAVITCRPLTAVDELTGQMYRMTSVAGATAGQSLSELESVYLNVLMSTLNTFHVDIGDYEADSSGLQLPAMDSSKKDAKLSKRDQDNLFIQALLRDVHREADNFSSIEHWESDLTQQILPMVSSRLQSREPTEIEKIQELFAVMDLRIRGKLASKAEEFIASREPIWNMKDMPLEEYAMKFLIKESGDMVDCVMLGMSRERYVDFALALLCT